MPYQYDAVVIGSGPNGLCAAIALAQAGKQVLLVEAEAQIGGGLRSAELLEPGVVNDVCSAVHPMGVLSPFMQKLPLAEHGLTWIYPKVSAAHPLDGGRAVILSRSLEETAAQLGSDAKAYKRLIGPFLDQPELLLEDALGPLRFPRRPIQFARFGLRAFRSALGLGRGAFAGEDARALFAGCAAHSVLPLDKLFTAALGVMFLLTGHMVDWPVARGGSAAIAAALASYFRSLGGEIRTSTRVSSLAELPEARVYLFDLAPKQVAEIAGDALPLRYRARLLRYNYGPAVFKLDYVLRGQIPWSAPGCAAASTVHVGGTMEEIARSERAAWQGEISEAPYLIVCQQSHFDDTRAPAGQHTGYAYCHAPFGSDVDMTAAIERQIERFAPGFADQVIARRATSPADIARYNGACIGGAITGGAADITQLFTRPVARLNPYTTPNPRLFLCGASTPPGGGVHGMCGYHAAHTALRRFRSASA
ncbi:MAG TPA: NAD(P)/FAD-dependent oxidoreductase [Polyangiales bacterium]|nr:NAD(P)/FAD-dependent oxidoreductase [Polyangiales bacterium]